MTTPTKDTLVALLKRKELNVLANDIEKGKTTFEEMLGFRREDWEKYYQMNGIAIYNHLHPSPLSSYSEYETYLAVKKLRQTSRIVYSVARDKSVIVF